MTNPKCLGERTQMNLELRRSVRRLLLLGCAAWFPIALTGSAHAAIIKIRVDVQYQELRRVIVQGERETGMETWSFRKSYGGVMGLGERISGFALTDQSGQNVGVKKLGPGEYKAEAAATRFYYEVELSPAIRSAEAAHVSWLTADRGLLLLGDLLPSFVAASGKLDQPLRLRFELPEAWFIASVEAKSSNTEFQITEPDNAVFFVSRDLRQMSRRLGGMDFIFSSSGDWAFSADELMSLARGIVDDYTKSLGAVPSRKAMLILSPFPESEGPGRWSAETRGSTVVLLSGKQPGRTAAVIQLGVPLTHEFFHLWVPNGLWLDGDYDWFYEGFTIYQAMRTAQKLNIMTFQDLLNGLGRAYDTYLSAAERDKLSLIEASSRRWTSGPSLIYQKSMLVALLYDLALRSHSKSKQSLVSVYHELFRRHRPGSPRAQANNAVLSVMSSFSGMKDFAGVHVETPLVIDLAAQLSPYGLRVEKSGFRTRIVPNPSLSPQQRDLLRGLGYNGEARESNRSR